ncbi:MAG: hypothetical protein ACRDTF_09645 [Pseudonocardiaceae bacterium]
MFFNPPVSAVLDAADTGLQERYRRAVAEAGVTTTHQLHEVLAAARRPDGATVPLDGRNPSGLAHLTALLRAAPDDGNQLQKLVDSHSRATS